MNERRLDRLVVHHGNEAHATGHHLVAGLRASGIEVIECGVGHEPLAAAVSPGVPLLWIESGRASFPRPADLAGRVTAAWLIDTHRGLEWRGSLATAFDHCFVAQIDAVEPIERLGTRTTWLPLASFDEATTPIEREREVGFVGFVQPGSRRATILERIAADFDLRRNDGYVAPEQIPAWYRSVEVVVNVPLERDLNMRVFEAAGAGAHLVTGPMNGLEELGLDDGITVVDGDDPSEWSRAIRAVLDDPGRRAAADRLREQVQREHTYADRARTVVERIAALEPSNHDVDDRRRVLASAAVRRHALGQAWSVAETPGGRVRAVPEVLAEVGRTARRRLVRGR